jgi:hypothetical protein
MSVVLCRRHSPRCGGRCAVTITPALQIALAIWNAGIARSRREYAEHPIAFGSGGVSSPPRDITCPCGTTFQAAGRPDSSSAPTSAD